MNEYILFFRMDLVNQENQPTELQMLEYNNQWLNWLNSSQAMNVEISGGNHFSEQGILINKQVEVTNSPYISDKNSIAGYITVYAENIEFVESFAKKCPILNGNNTSVEIRKIENPQF